MILPRYPVYVISKGRPDLCSTARFLNVDRVPFTLVVEPQEADAYHATTGAYGTLATLPFSNLGLGSIPARNWVWENARALGHDRHWILDDNIRAIFRYWDGKRLYCDAGPALAAVEDFVDRYTNIAIAGLNYKSFVIERRPPFVRNLHVYSCLLIQNDLAQRWRGRYNEDTDLCLQVLAAGLCTVLVNVFLIEKLATMSVRGGNTTELYAGDGRLKMARALERMWPGVVRVDRRWGRPQHVVDWRRFRTPLQLRPDVDLATVPDNDYGLRLVAERELTPAMQRLYDRYHEQATA